LLEAVIAILTVVLPSLSRATNTIPSTEGESLFGTLELVQSD